MPFDDSDIKKMIATWMRENRSLKWSIGCKFVQLQKNHTYHSANKKSPYETCFGIETPMGLKATRVPIELWKDMKSFCYCADTRCRPKCCGSSESYM